MILSVLISLVECKGGGGRIGGTVGKGGYISISSKTGISGKQTTGPVYFLLPSGELILGDMDACIYGCSYDGICGTKRQCKEPKLSGSVKLLVSVGALVSCCCLCTCISN